MGQLGCHSGRLTQARWGEFYEPYVCLAERQVFLATWKDIPNENELQYQIKECHLNAGRITHLYLSVASSSLTSSLPSSF